MSDTDELEELALPPSRWRSALERVKGRGLALSTATSMLGRILSSLSTIVAMPIALKTLGEGRFGAFLVLAGVVNWINLGGFGIPSALGKLIAAGGVSEERKRRLFGGALAYGTASTIVFSTVVLMGFIAWVRTLYPHNPSLRSELGEAGGLMIVLVALQIILQICEGLRIGGLQNYVLNLVRIGGSLFSFACLIILPPILPKVISFVIALNGGLLIGALFNAILVLRNTWPDFGHLKTDWKEIRALAGSGSSFFIIGIGSFFQTNVPTLILSLMFGTAASIDFGLYIRLLFVQMIGLGMFTTPLWPAIINARSQKDERWLIRSLTSIGLIVTAGGLCSFVVLSFGGSTLLRLWSHVIVKEGPWFGVAFGFYFLQMAWSHYWTTVLMGFGREKIASRVIIAEAVMLVGIGSALAIRYGPLGMIIGMNIGFFLMSAWLLPFLVLRGHAAGKPIRAMLTQAYRRAA